MKRLIVLAYGSAAVLAAGCEGGGPGAQSFMHGTLVVD
jgi:hypothetical protein